MKKEISQMRMALALFGLLLALPAAEALAAPTYVVNCGSGQSLAQTLNVAPPGSTIKLTGVCQERVTISTDGITLDGQGTAILQGEGPGPSPSEFDAVVTIDGAHRVSLRGLTVQNSPRQGILAKNGASFRLENVTAQNNGAVGIHVTANSSGELEAVTSRDNNIGLGVFNSATVILHGAITLIHNAVEGLDAESRSTVEMHQAQLNASNNGSFGLLIGGSDLYIRGFPTPQPSSISANSNGLCGLLIPSGGRLVVQVPGPFFGSGINLIRAENNGACGISLPVDGAIDSPFGGAQFIIANNPVGLRYGNNSGGLILGGLQVHNNGIGVLANGAGHMTFGSFGPNTSSITGNSTDVDLRFGSRVTFCGMTTVGTVTNDSTALARTLANCPPPF
jgi:hypothetical protein